ncbi:MAG TPA: ABC transporter permease, partial [Candidatus Acidoferrum sp.]|nr:ABC transporter permease [Candidatus Acidoferrum sp.]
MAELWRDIRFGLRTLAKNPGFTAVAVLTLALGIGANAAIFSILDPLLLRKLPVKNPDELVLVHAAGSVLSDGISEVSTYIIYRDQNRIFSGVLAVAGARGYPVTKDNQTSQIDGEEVSGTFFDVLGVNPFRGRMLAAGDSEAPSGNPVVVLSFDYWRTAFNGDESIIGKTLTIRDRVFTIIGVAPPGFFGVEVGSMPSFYIPIGSRQRANLWVAILARLKQGISLEQAKAGLEPVFEQAMAASTVPEIEKQQEMSRLVIVPAAHGLSDLRSEFSLPAKILMGVVGMVLLIACSNVASLLFARSTARRKEITIRLALGAGRWRLVRQLLTESALLVVAGSAFGLIAASWISRILIAPLSTEKGQIHL